MAKTISTILFLAALGFAGYLAATGVTLHDCGAWIERQLGVRFKNSDMKNVPHTGYAPIVPGR